MGREAFGLVCDHSVNYWGCEKRNISRRGCCWWNNFPPLFSTMAINRVSVLSPDGQKWREFKWLHVSSVPRDVLWWPVLWLFWDCFISLSFFALPWKLVRCFRNTSTLTAKLYFQFCLFPKGSYKSTDRPHAPDFGLESHTASPELTVILYLNQMWSLLH